jgi:hypothetical protein
MWDSDHLREHTARVQFQPELLLHRNVPLGSSGSDAHCRLNANFPLSPVESTTGRFVTRDEGSFARVAIVIPRPSMRQIPPP